MADKILNTRIQLKYDTLANWEAKNTVLKMGEVGFAAIDVNIPPVSNELNGTSTNREGLKGANRTILFKIGDGQTPWKQLNWANALAADVYGWAKQANLPVVRNDAEGQTEGNVISGISWDGTGIKYTTASVATSEGMATLQKEIYGETTREDGKSRIDLLEEDIAANRDAWAEKTVNTNDNTTYAFEIITNKENEHYGELAITATHYTLGNAGTPTTTYVNVVTPDELNALVDGKLHTQSEIETIAANKIGALISAADDADEKVLSNIADLVNYVEENAADIAELVGNVNTANTNASNAVTTANEAAETAGQALEKANEALTGAEGAAASAAAAKASEDNAKASENAAAGSAADALTSQNAASASAGEAAVYAATAGAKAGEANTAKEAAEAAQGAAERARDAALQAKADAETAKQNAVNAQVLAETAKSGADAAKQAAEAAQAAAEQAKDDATGAANGAAGSSAVAAGHAEDAGKAKVAAKAAQAKAEEAQAAAEQAKADAEASNTSATAIANEAKAASETATNAVNDIKTNYIRVAEDNKMYLGMEGTDTIIFDCGGAE